jgi:hypothetical protein
MLGATNRRDAIGQEVMNDVVGERREQVVAIAGVAPIEVAECRLGLSRPCSGLP